MRLWPRLWVFLFLGYNLMGRTFAYIGIPQLKLFLGEAVLAGFLALRPGAVLGRWAYWLSQPRMGALFLLAWSLQAFFVYGIFEAFAGLARGHEALLILQNLVFNVYPLYLFFGIYAGLRFPSLLPRALRWLAWLNGIYGLLYLSLLSRLEAHLPWAPDVPLFGQPGGSAVALLGLLVFEPRPGRVWYLFLLNLLVLFGVQVRGEWLAFALALTVWALVRGRMVRLALIGALLVFFFGALYAFDLRLPAPEHRGGELSARGIVARVIAPFNPDLAANLVGEEAYSFAGTITGWRVPWWVRIWETVHQDFATALLGLGYGFPLWSLYEAIPEGIRTPHNAFFYSLGYTGWLGVFLFFAFIGALMWALYKASRMSLVGEFAFVVSLGQVGSGLFGNFFETPFGAIPFYLVAGYSLATLIRFYASYKDSHPLPTTGR